ncbi:universal stress protein [Natronomonas salsuginis]|uniref:Universal stress protein n=1 Tax=Natronomonas salsuginis TaxID=2217661 RepID=A0A4U5JNZ1_9EURY|nr:universal stress protein [Natronomonas salsuginis]TKR27919.1 universal stress protein [Natronomonas salsuginis]
MLARVLVPMDDSALSEEALRHALDAHPTAEITVLHVVGGPSSMMGEAANVALADDPEAEASDHAKNVMARAAEIAAEHDREIETEVRIGHPARTIVDVAEEFDAVVIGSHSGTLAERLIVGNVAETIVRRSPVPVTVVR